MLNTELSSHICSDLSDDVLGGAGDRCLKNDVRLIG